MFSCAGFAEGADWPGFRGATGDATSREVDVLPSGPIRLEVVWKRPIGSGYAGPAVAEGSVVTAFAKGKKDVLAAFDEETGLERWRRPIDDAYAGHDGSHDGPIATPLIANHRVFGLSAQGTLIALDLKSGKTLWSTNLVADHAARQPFYGFAASPLMHDGVLVVEIGSPAGATAGFDPETGKRLWAIGSDRVQYQSPVSMTLHGQSQVVAACDTNLFGIDAREGKQLWQYAHGGGGPRGAGSLVAVPAGDDRLFLSYKDDSSTTVEFTSDGRRVTGKSLWESGDIRNSYNVPVYHDGHVYAYSSRFLTCVDISTGKSTWRSREPGDGFTILVDGRLVVLTKQGGLHVIDASPEAYREVASAQVFDDMAWSPPAFANGHILARGLRELARVRITAGPPVEPKEESARSIPKDTSFAAFLAEVSASPDKTGVIDAFMERTSAFPVIEEGWVHFVYRGPGEDLAVGSDLFGARQERAMTRIPGTDVFHLSSTAEPDLRANYVFIRDFADHLTDPRNPRKTKSAIFTNEMEMNFGGGGDFDMSWFAMPQWNAPGFLETTADAARGSIERKELASKLENQKIELDVYTPAGYASSDARYPVAYVHGGDAAIERGDWPLALDNLIGSAIQPVIVVFIRYTPPVFRPNKYPQMFAEELVPLIDELYRTIAERNARASVGAGFAGPLALSCALQDTQLVGKLGCQSPFVFGSLGEALKQQLLSRIGPPLTIYIEWGKYDFRNPDEAWDLNRSIAELAATLRTKRHRVTGGEVNDGTGWSSWRNRTDHLVRTLFPKS